MKKRVLFVDDEAQVLDGLRDLLYRQRRRWDMVFALDGESALGAFDEAPFDVIVSASSNVMLNACMCDSFFGLMPQVASKSKVIVLASAVFLAVQMAITTVTLWMFVIYAAVLFFSFGLMFGNLNAIAMEPMGEVAGMASAIMGAVSSVISLTLGTAIGQMYDYTLVPITCGFLGLGSLAWILMKVEQRWHLKTVPQA